jgi:hypothetical protein
VVAFGGYLSGRAEGETETAAAGYLRR